MIKFITSEVVPEDTAYLISVGPSAEGQREIDRRVRSGEPLYAVFPEVMAREGRLIKVTLTRRPATPDPQTRGR